MNRFTAGAVALVLTFALVGHLSAQGIAGTAHDFSGATWNTAGEICNVCHTPHSAGQYQEGPLWDHEVTTQSFAAYNDPNGTIDNTLSTDVVTDGTASKLCLSCHDGSVALDDFGGTTTGTNFIAAAGNLYSPNTNAGGADDHPIGIDYDDAVDTGLKPATTALGSGTIGDFLIAGKVECSTCHDVHDDDGNTNFLRAPNTTSALCRTCHNR